MKILNSIRTDDPFFKKNIWTFLAAYFLVLFNYPLIRASSTALFFEAYGAKSSPLAWLFAIALLSIAIFFCNLLQKRYSVQKVFFAVSLTSALIFSGSLLGKFSFLSFIWKEVYIVLQVHLLLAYANNYLKKEEFKVLVGPVGAIGSLGGILGGLLTSYISTKSGVNGVMGWGVAFVLLPGLIFLKVLHVQVHNLRELTKSPLTSLKTLQVKKYVFYIAVIVALTQFIINIADFKFNLVFEAAISEQAKRTEYLGYVYTVTNALTFLFQFLLLPLLLPRVSERNFHLFIPISYFLCLIGLVVGQGVALLPVAAFYIYFKASDYSFFSAGKEILYQPLSPTQKYGAKYITDMLVYRLSKGMIAAVLIYIQSSFMLNMMMSIFLLLWVIMVIKLFQIDRTKLA